MKTHSYYSTPTATAPGIRSHATMLTVLAVLATATLALIFALRLAYNSAELIPTPSTHSAPIGLCRFCNDERIAATQPSGANVPRHVEPQQEVPHPADELVPGRSRRQVCPVELVEVAAHAVRPRFRGLALPRGEAPQFERSGAGVGLAPGLGRARQPVRRDDGVVLPGGGNEAADRVHRYLFAHCVDEQDSLLCGCAALDRDVRWCRRRVPRIGIITVWLRSSIVHQAWRH